jgi:hypothetical protein
VLHCPSWHGTAIVRHGTTSEGQPRSRGRAGRRGRGRPLLLASPSAGLWPEVKEQSVAMAMQASGSRATARLWHVSPPPVLPALTPRRLTANRSSRRPGRPSSPSRGRSSAGALRSGLNAAGGPPHARRWGALGASKQSRGGSGRPWLLTGGRCERRAWGDGRMRCGSHGQSSEPLVISPASLPLAGAPTSAIALPRSTRWAKRRRRRATARPSRGAPG